MCPSVGIGVPVRNGERFLAAALASLCAQTFEDLEVVVCDNASTDGTPEIALDFARRDPRVRHERVEEPVGAAASFERAFRRTRGELFRWHAADDLVEPTYLERCRAVLAAEQETVLCHTRVRFVDAEGEPLAEHDPRITRQDAPDRRTRFRELCSLRHWCFDVFGLTRREVLARTPRIAPYPGSDRNLLAELALHGRLRRLDEPLFLSRDHGDRSIRAMTRLADRAAWFDPALAGRRVYPHWRHLAEFARSLRRAGVPAGERLGCTLDLGRWALRFRRELLSDLWPRRAG